MIKMYRFCFCMFTFCVFFIVSGCATNQVAVNGNDSSKKNAQMNINKPVVENRHSDTIGQETEEALVSASAKDIKPARENNSEEEQEIIEKILILLDEADAYWDDG
ncbi:MAG: hypothetical protein JW914_07400, partial [Syntrophaceae bacterium]|nr:hypothetical protein [Syntrophaceae bacterium]